MIVTFDPADTFHEAGTQADNFQFGADESSKPQTMKPGEKDTSSKSLKEAAMKNPTVMGDPVSLKAEKSSNEPTDQDRGAKGGKGQSKL